MENLTKSNRSSLAVAQDMKPATFAGPTPNKRPVKRVIPDFVGNLKNVSKSSSSKGPIVDKKKKGGKVKAKVTMKKGGKVKKSK